MPQQTITTTARSTYRAYLLRLWQEDSGSRWRVTLEDPHSDERRAFPDLDSFVQHLHLITGAEDENNGEGEGAER